MKYILESSDIKPGVKFKNKKKQEALIGYRFADDPNGKTVFYLICLVGWINGYVLKETVNKEDIVEFLNKYEYLPVK